MAHTMHIVGSRFYLKGEQENDMRGDDKKSEGMFCYISAESVVPKDHPLRPIRTIADKALQDMSSAFEEIYSHTGRPSIAPKKLMKGLLLQTLYSIKSAALRRMRLMNPQLILTAGFTRKAKGKRRSFRICGTCLWRTGMV